MSRVDVTSFAWMTGQWQGHIGEERIEESWSTPEGGTLIGMFRWLKNGAPYLYEFMSIEPMEDGLALRIKHFNPGLVGWEEKEQASVLTLASASAGEAVFERKDNMLQRIVYRKQGDGALTVRLETKGEGEANVMEFHYERRE